MNSLYVDVHAQGNRWVIQLGDSGDANDGKPAITITSASSGDPLAELVRFQQELTRVINYVANRENRGPDDSPLLDSMRGLE